MNGWKYIFLNLLSEVEESENAACVLVQIWKDALSYMLIYDCHVTSTLSKEWMFFD